MATIVNMIYLKVILYIQKSDLKYHDFVLLTLWSVINFRFTTTFEKQFHNLITP